MYKYKYINTYTAYVNMFYCWRILKYFDFNKYLKKAIILKWKYFLEMMLLEKTLVPVATVTNFSIL